LKIVDRTPALEVSGIAPDQTLSITFNFPIDFIKITKDNLFTDYFGYGSSHNAGKPTVTSISWSTNFKILTIEISGWSGVDPLDTQGAAVHVVPRSGKVKDIFGNITSATLWDYYIGERPGPKIATPTFVLSVGSYEANTLEVTIECTTTLVELRYTTDQSTPTQSSALYNGPFAIDRSQTINVIGFRTGYQQSDMASATYDLTWWQPLGGGTNAIINAVAAGSLYAGGLFNDAGGVAVGQVAGWDGNAWFDLGGGVDQTVYAIGVASNDDVYVGGDFNTAGPVGVQGIARWDGANWNALAGGLDDGRVNAIAIDSSDNVYIGGTFTGVDGVANTSKIAKWNGSSWSALGTGINGDVRAIVHDPVTGYLYAGGNFDIAGGNAANRIARWDGFSWSALGSGTDGSVDGLAVNQTFLFVCGGFSSAGGKMVNRIARWDGSNWSDVDGGVGEGMASVHALACDNNGNLYIGGAFTAVGGVSVPAKAIAKWDGSSWSEIGLGIDGTVYGLAFDNANSKLYAAGFITSAGGITANNIAVWGKK
jgi:hypothetical protein